VHSKFSSTAPVSSATKKKKKLVTVGNRWHSRQFKLKHMLPNEGKKKGEKSASVGVFDNSAEHGTDLMASTFTHDGLWK